MAKTYTVQNPQGQTVTFEWSGENPPTDSNMEEVCKSASILPTSKPEQPSFTKTAIGDITSRFKGMAQGIAALPGLVAQAPQVIGESLDPTNPKTIARGQAIYDIAKKAPSMAMDYLKQVPQHPVGTAMDIATMAVPEAALAKLGTLGKIGKAAEIGARALNPAEALALPVKGVAGLLAKKSTPFMEAAKAEGMTSYPVSAATTSPTLKKIEAGLSAFSPLDQIQAKLERSKQFVINSFNDMAGKITGGKETYDIGKELSDHMEGVRQEFDQIERNLYQKAKRNTKPIVKAPISLNRANILLKSVLKQPTLSGDLEKYGDVQKLQDFVSGPKTMEQVDAKIRELNQDLKKAYANPAKASGNEGILKQAAQFMRNEFSSKLGQIAPQVRNDLMSAKKFRQDNLNQITKTLFTDTNKLLQEDKFDKMVKSLVNPNTSEEDISRIQTLAKNPNFKSGKFVEDGMKAAVMKQIIDASVAVGKGEQKAITVEKLSQTIDKWGDRKLTMIFGPDIAAKLRNQRLLAGVLGGIKELPVGGFRKGEIGLIEAGAAGTEVIRGDFKPLMLLGLLQGGNSFMASEWGQKLISEGVLAPETAGKIGKATKNMGRIGYLENKTK